jgi:hypothetical protein
LSQTVPSSRSELFARLHFEGRRFDDHALPLDLMGELLAYQQAVRAASRLVFLLENPHRRRVSFELFLSLGPVRGGSALPDINRLIVQEVRAGQQSLLPDDDDDDDKYGVLFARARDFISKLVHDGGESDLLRRSLGDRQHVGSASRAVVSAVSHFGQGLWEGETLGLRGPTSDGDDAKLTRDFGDAVRRLYGSDEESEQDETVAGTIRASNRDLNIYSLATPDGGRVPLEAPPLFFKQLTRSMLDDGSEVEVRGRATYRNGKLHRLLAFDVKAAVDGRFELRRAPDTVMSDQLATVGSLEDGWDDDAAKAPLGPTVSRAREVLTSLMSRHGLPCPFVYPTFDGAVRAEWPMRQVNAVLEVHADGTLKLILVQVRTGRGEQLNAANADEVADAVGRFVDEEGRA